MSRKRLSPGALYTLLNAELKRLKPAVCHACRMPLPFLVERPDDVSANWRIGTAPACVHGCDSLIAEIATRLWPEYDLADPLAQAVQLPAVTPKEKA